MKTGVVVLLLLGFLCGEGSSSLRDNDIKLKSVLGGKWTQGHRNPILDYVIDQVMNIYAPVSEAVENPQCKSDSELYKEGVKEGQLWALNMLDSSSKIPEGFLMGDFVDLGNYDECVEVEGVGKADSRFSGQHCMVTLLDGDSPVREAGEESPQHKFRAVQQRVALAHKSTEQGSTRMGGGIGGGVFGVKWSMCIPSSCTSRDLEVHMRSTLQDVLNMTFSVQNSDCSSRAHVHRFTASDWFAVGFMSFFGVLIVLSTAFDLITSNSESRPALLISFSVYTNGSKLLKLTPGTDTLQAVHGIRFLSMAWVVLGHTYLYGLLAPTINLVIVKDFITDFKHLFITNATLSVDSFFLLSGLLLSYIFLKEMEKPRASFNVPLFYLHRYIRLTPAFGVMMLLTATLFYHMGSGPMWESQALLARRSCEESWWVGMLYINNYYHQDNMCVGQSWYLAVDMQLFWLSPLVLYPLRRWPRVGKCLLGFLIFIGLLTAFLIPFIYELPSSILASGDAEKMQYFPTHTRFTPWLIGIGLGYLLHTTKDTSLRLSKVTVIGGWMLSAALLLTSWLLAYRFNQWDHTYERVFESLYTCLMRPAWALGLAWVVFACTKGYGGFVNTFLSWQFFQVLSRLTYTVYLTHMTVMTWITASTRVPVYLHDRTLITQFFSYLVISFGVAFVLSVAFESPAIVIEKVLLQKLVVGRQKKKPVPDEPAPDSAVNVSQDVMTNENPITA